MTRVDPEDPILSAPRGERAATRWVVVYLVLAYALAWCWWVPLAVADEVTRAGQGWPTHLVGLCAPALAAVATTAMADGRAGLRDLWQRAVRWRGTGRWWLVVAATLALCGLGFAAPLWGGEAPELAELGLYSGAPGFDGAGLLVLLAYVLVVNGFGEELGWRGFLAERLLVGRGRVTTATLVWVAWALWHLPLFLVVENFRDFTLVTTIGWVVGLWFGSFFLTWLYLGSGRSVLVAASWHAAYNLSTATEATSGVSAAVSSTMVMAVTALVMVVSARRAAAERR